MCYVLHSNVLYNNTMYNWGTKTLGEVVKQNSRKWIAVNETQAEFIFKLQRRINDAI